MTKDEFIASIKRNRINCAILAGLPALGLNDAWLVSGALFQTVWNVITGRAPDYGINDYDIPYFDHDTSWDAEDAVIRKADAAFTGLGVRMELRNQARVHLWYEKKFGAPYPPLTRATDSIDRFLMPCAQVGISAAGAVYAPSGFDDIASMTIRPNVTANFRADLYLKKAMRWKSLWPELTILAPNDGTGS